MIRGRHFRLQRHIRRSGKVPGEGPISTLAQGSLAKENVTRVQSLLTPFCALTEATESNKRHIRE